MSTYFVYGWAQKESHIAKAIIYGVTTHETELYLERHYGVGLKEFSAQVNIATQKDLKQLQKLLKLNVLKRLYRIEASSADEAMLYVAGLSLPTVKASQPLDGRPALDGDFLCELLEEGEVCNLYALKGIHVVEVGRLERSTLGI